MPSQHNANPALATITPRVQPAGALYRSQSDHRAGVCCPWIGRTKVSSERTERSVAGVARDEDLAAAAGESRGHERCSERVGAVLPAVQSRRFDGRFHNPVYLVGVHPRGLAPELVGEQRPWVASTYLEPAIESPDGAGLGNSPSGYCDDPAAALLVLLLLADVNQQALFRDGNIRQVERHQVRPSQRGSEADRQESAIARTRLSAHQPKVLYPDRFHLPGLFSSESFGAVEQSPQLELRGPRVSGSSMNVVDGGDVASRCGDFADAEYVGDIKNDRVSRRRQRTPAHLRAPLDEQLPVSSVGCARAHRADALTEPFPFRSKFLDRPEHCRIYSRRVFGRGQYRPGFISGVSAPAVFSGVRDNGITSPEGAVPFYLTGIAARPPPLNSRPSQPV